MDGRSGLWAAMAGSPARFLGSATPWRCWAYAASGAVLGAAVLLTLLFMTVLGVVLSPALIGLVVLALLGVAGIPIGALERRRVRLLGERPVPSPHPVVRAGPPRRWLAIRLRESATRRAFAYTLLMAAVFWLLDYVAAALPLVALVLLSSPAAYAAFAGADGLTLFNVHLASTGETVTAAVIAALVLLLSAYLVTAVAALRFAMVRTLLAVPRDGDARVMELISTSGRVLNGFDERARRIERDLHDGTQQRLIALGMTLDLAGSRLGGAAPPVAELLAKARDETTRALAELRAIIQDIHPHVLTERGLPEAVAELALGHVLPVDIELTLSGRLRPAVESTAFFVISEALANVAKHAHADRAWVHGWLDGDTLVIEVGDTGRGGADPRRGSGLRGLADRTTMAGGQVLISSPPGGPTVLRTRIPRVLPGPN